MTQTSQPRSEPRRDGELTDRQLDTVTGGDKSKTTNTQSSQIYLTYTMQSVFVTSIAWN